MLSIIYGTFCCFSQLKSLSLHSSQFEIKRTFSNYSSARREGTEESAKKNQKQGKVIFWTIIEHLQVYPIIIFLPRNDFVYMDDLIVHCSSLLDLCTGEQKEKEGVHGWTGRQVKLSQL